MPDNKLQLTAYASMFRIMDRQIGVYAPLADGNAILKKFYNDGNYNHGQLGANITSKLFNQRLVVSVAPRWLMYVTTGENSATYYPFSCSINAEYYFKRIALSAFWNSPWGYVDGDTAYKRYFASEYAIGISWANKGWNIGLTAADFFRSSWKLSNDHLSTKWYTYQATTIGAQYHRRITLNVAYTFSYGKKIDKSSVLEGNIGVSSSILR